MFVDQIKNPEDLWKHAHSALDRSNADRSHPFNYAVFATVDKFPRLRTVVKRKMSEELDFLFYTDSRSKKVSEMRQTPESTLLFYDDKHKLQIRINGTSHIVQDSPEYNHHFQIAKQNPGDYTSEKTPGSPIKSINKVAKQKKLQFALIKFHPQRWDILQLHREGHLRAIFEKEADRWAGHWVVP